AAPGLAVRLLRRGEDARLEAPAGASLERAADARDVAHVDAQGDDHRGPSVLSARWLVTRPPSREPQAPHRPSQWPHLAASTLARATGVAGGGIGGRRLQPAERLAAFREQVA